MNKNNIRPHHYVGVDGHTQVNDVLANYLPKQKDGYIAHLMGNAIEYILRAEFKNGTEDYEKAIENLQLILNYKARQREIEAIYREDRGD